MFSVSLSGLNNQWNVAELNVNWYFIIWVCLNLCDYHIINSEITYQMNNKNILLGICEKIASIGWYLILLVDTFKKSMSLKSTSQKSDRLENKMKEAMMKVIHIWNQGLRKKKLWKWNLGS